MHFTRMGGYATDEVPIIVRGEGCYLEDANGRRYLDALAGLFSVNIGYSFGEEIGQAALEQMRELPFYTNWSYAHPRAIELAAEVASLAPGDLNRVFFCLRRLRGGGVGVEARAPVLRGSRREAAARWRPRPRRGTTRSCAATRAPRAATRRSRGTSRTTARRSARSRSTASPRSAMPFEPLVPEVRHVSNTNRYHRPAEETEEEFTQFLLDELEQAILAMGPETVCLVHMEPVQNAGGCVHAARRLLAGRARALRRVRHPALGGRGDHRLRPPRPLVRLGALRHPAGHRHLGEGPLLLVRGDRRRDRDRPGDGAVPRVDLDVLARDHLRRPSGDVRDRAQEHRDHEARAGSSSTCARTRQAFRAKLETLLDLPIVGDVRGTGFFYAIELVKDKETRETFDDDECETLLRGYLSQALFEAGLICRADDRGDPVVQISPPLVAGEKEMDEIVGILGEVLAEASRGHSASDVHGCCTIACRVSRTPPAVAVGPIPRRQEHGVNERGDR